VQLLQANRNRIYAFILSLVANKNDADDIMQETTIVMWRKFNQFQKGTDFMAWALAIARYQVLSYRKQNPGSRLVFGDAMMAALENESAQIIKQYDDRISTLKKCLKKLKDNDKRLIFMRYEENCPSRLIAERYGYSVRAINKALARIHDALLRCIRRNLAVE
ncbi:MAG: sigma-70 family RNA polymerase sigma factor, partial [Sedimentisphaerales bacterium]|nr:sigma-70 family RNA polymerase sigma factor [Sedimentisphaerales bacterium]